MTLSNFHRRAKKGGKRKRGFHPLEERKKKRMRYETLLRSF